VDTLYIRVDGVTDFSVHILFAVTDKMYTVQAQYYSLRKKIAYLAIDFLVMFKDSVITCNMVTLYISPGLTLNKIGNVRVK
jgi:hypothetical protein